MPLDPELVEDDLPLEPELDDDDFPPEEVLVQVACATPACIASSAIAATPVIRFMHPIPVRSGR